VLTWFVAALCLTPRGAFAESIDFALPPLLYPERSFDGMFLEDFDEDGRPDIASTGSWTTSPGQEFPEYGILVHENLGGGELAAPRRLSLGFASYFTPRPRFRARVDLDADGRRDYVVEIPSDGIEPTLVVLIRDGAWGFRDPQRFQPIRNIQNVAVADLDGDTDLDLAVALQPISGPAWIALYENTGDANFAFWRESDRLR
jgi:hypothetical protein